jgi:hypothetical protein
MEAFRNGCATPLKNRWHTSDSPGRATARIQHRKSASYAALAFAGAIAVERDPVRDWREQYGRCCHHLDFEPLPDKPFHYAVKPIFDEPRIVRTTLSPGFIFRDQELVRDCDDSVSLVISSSRKLNILHRGREVQLAPGEATIMQADAPGRCGSHEGFVVSEIMISPAEWVARGAHPTDALMLDCFAAQFLNPRPCRGILSLG